MKILHTADWHLGKKLEGNSRLPEQEEFLQELASIADTEQVDLILVAGDIYDTYNPPAAAEALLYRFMLELTRGGERPLLMIAGNHDHPERLSAVMPLAGPPGVMFAGLPGNVIPCGRYGQAQVVDSGIGYVHFKLKGEQVVCLLLPYPSEKRMNELWTKTEEETEEQRRFSDRIAAFWQAASSHYRNDTINLALAHLYIAGGLGSDSERSIDVGGALAVDPEALPPAQYIALGHLHRPQRAPHSRVAYYAGSPLQYSRGEMHYSKSVYLVEVQAGQPAQIERRWLRNYRPLAVWECSSIEEAVQQAQADPAFPGWLYLDIRTARPLTGAEIQTLKTAQPGIVQIRADWESEETVGEESTDQMQLRPDELFKSFYEHERGAEVPPELMKLFYEVNQQAEEKADATVVP